MTQNLIPVCEHISSAASSRGIECSALVSKVQHTVDIRPGHGAREVHTISVTANGHLETLCVEVSANQQYQLVYEELYPST
jgi:hypothetical protein